MKEISEKVPNVTVFIYRRNIYVSTYLYFLLKHENICNSIQKYRNVIEIVSRIGYSICRIHLLRFILMY